MDQPRRREEEAIVLDYLQNGYSFDTRPMHLKTAIVQALGTDRFTLLELVPKKDVHIQPRATVYIGDQKRDEIHHVNGKIPMDKMTATAQSELPFAIKAIIDKNPQRFVDFYNKAQPLSIRTHSLELLPGVGKKHMQEILDARAEKDFESFEDIRARVKLIQDPEKLIINRILNEIKGQEKHYLFTAPPANEEDDKRRLAGGPRRDMPPRDGPRFGGGPRRDGPRRF